MKLATLTASVLILSATLISGTASAQTGNLVMMPGAKTCWINGQQLFNCQYIIHRHYKRVPPTYDPNNVKEMGNNGAETDKGSSRGGRGGNSYN